MELKIIQNRESKLLSRKEILAQLVYSGKTPSNEEVSKEIAKSFPGEGLIVINRIKTRHGSAEAEVNAYVYDSKEAMIKITKKGKKAIEKEKKIEEKASEAKKGDG